jgi:hypothetical protein
MPKSKPWLKMWVESLDDPKMRRLTLAEEAVWWRLLRLAQRCNCDGSLITSSGSPLALHEMMDCLHLVEPDDKAAFYSMLKKMETEGSLCWNKETLHIIHFVERQELIPSETPEAVRERVRLFRERHRHQPESNEKSVTSNGLSPLQPSIPSLLEEDTRYRETPLRNGVTSVTSDVSVTEISLQSADLASKPQNGDKVNLEGKVEAKMEQVENVTGKPLQPQTPGTKYLFEKTNRKRWQNLVQKEMFEATEAEVGESRMIEAINWALGSGINNVKSICTAAKKGSNHGTKPSANNPGQSNTTNRRGTFKGHTDAEYEEARRKLNGESSDS